MRDSLLFLVKKLANSWIDFFLVDGRRLELKLITRDGPDLLVPATTLLSNIHRSSFPSSHPPPHSFPLFIPPFESANCHGRPDGRRSRLHHRQIVGGPRKPPWKAGAVDGIGDSFSLHQGEGNIHIAANSAGAGGPHQGMSNAFRRAGAIFFSFSLPLHLFPGGGTTPTS